MGGANFTPAAGDVILKKDQWQTIFTWGGWSPLAFLIWDIQVQDQFREFPIEWRRYGVGFPPYWQGEFRGEASFSVKPLVDIFIRVELRSKLADVGINIRHRTVGLILFDK
jgi:hypothetical protein